LFLDPLFPCSIGYQGYSHALECLKSLFTKYAASGLTRESDREIAISGVLGRMEPVTSEHKCGVFKLFMFRLLLWRAEAIEGSNTARYHASNHLPSWSWMRHHRLEFFPDEHIQVPQEVVKFGSGGELHVRISSLQNCEMDRTGHQHILLGDDGKEVGKLWLDTQFDLEIRDCVVIGMQNNEVGEDAEIFYFILLVSNHNDGKYQRIRAGMAKAYYLSSRYQEGVLI
jgi:hypothetical protein